MSEIVPEPIGVSAPSFCTSLYRSVLRTLLVEFNACLRLQRFQYQGRVELDIFDGLRAGSAREEVDHRSTGPGQNTTAFDAMEVGEVAQRLIDNKSGCMRLLLGGLHLVENGGDGRRAGAAAKTLSTAFSSPETTWAPKALYTAIATRP